MADENNWPPCSLTTRTKHLLWSTSIDRWKKTGKLPEFLVVEMGTLRDRDGDPLSDEVLEFLFDLLLNANRIPMKQKAAEIERAVIRGQYPSRLIFERYGDPATRPPGKSPADLVKEHLGARFKKSVAVIDQIVNPRPSRQARKQRKP